jgi:hypothetical protein
MIYTYIILFHILDLSVLGYSFCPWRHTFSAGVPDQYFLDAFGWLLLFVAHYAQILDYELDLILSQVQEISAPLDKVVHMHEAQGEDDDICRTM